MTLFIFLSEIKKKIITDQKRIRGNNTIGKIWSAVTCIYLKSTYIREQYTVSHRVFSIKKYI